jgi:hypothetical protein
MMPDLPDDGGAPSPNFTSPETTVETRQAASGSLNGSPTSKKM